MEALQPALLVLGFAVGILVYVGLAVALLRGARTAVTRAIALYWRERSRRETVAVNRRVAEVQAPPRRRAA